ISLRCHAMSFQTHDLPQMDSAVGPKLPVLLLDAHVPRRLATDELLDGMHHALLDVTAKRLTDVQVLPVTCIVIARGRLSNGPSHRVSRTHAAFPAGPNRQDGNRDALGRLPPR